MADDDSDEIKEGYRAQDSNKWLHITENTTWYDIFSNDLSSLKYPKKR